MSISSTTKSYFFIYKPKQFQDFKDKDTDARLHIKGQLLYVEEWKMMIFLGCPFIHNLKTMIENGLFISDMSTHGTIRLIILKSISQTFYKQFFCQFYFPKKV